MEAVFAEERARSHEYGGRSVFGSSRRRRGAQGAPEPRTDAATSPCAFSHASARSVSGNSRRVSAQNSGEWFMWLHMRDLVRGEIVEHVGRREDQPPGEIERAGRGAGAPAARGVAQRQPARLDAGGGGVAGDGGFEIAPRLALEIIGDAARHMRRLAGDAEQRPLGALLPPDDAARVRPMRRCGGRRRAAARFRRAGTRPAAAAARAARRSRRRGARRNRAPA